MITQQDKDYEEYIALRFCEDRARRLCDDQYVGLVYIGLIPSQDGISNPIRQHLVHVYYTAKEAPRHNLRYVPEEWHRPVEILLRFIVTKELKL